MTKRIYLAGKLNAGELSIAEFADEIERRGHTVLEKWWQQNELPIPYLEHLEISAVAARNMVDAAYSSDVVILFPGDTILGAAVELGAAIASTKVNPKKQVIVVNPYGVRQSVFYAHSAATAVRDVTQIREMEWF